MVCVGISLLWSHRSNLALNILRYIVIFLVSVFFLWQCCDVTLANALFFGIGAYGVQHLAYNMHSIIMYFLLPFEIETYSGLYFAILIAVYLIVYTALYFIFFRRVKREKSLIVSRKKLYFIVLIFLAVVIGLNTALLAYSFGSDSPLRPLCHLYAIFCCVLFLSIQFDFFEQNKLREEKLLMQQLLNLKDEQKQRSEQSIDIINMKCHDLKHQFAALRKMNREDMDKAITEAENAISFYDATADTGCVALNIILTEKSLIRQQYNIKFDFLVEGEKLAFMDDIDVYTLFGNAIDNAIESVMQEEEDRRILHLEIRSKDSFLCIKLENYCSREISFQDGLPLTSKKDRSNHGFGTKSISYIVKKYRGTLKMEQTGENFLLKMIFPLS